MNPAVGTCPVFGCPVLPIRVALMKLNRGLAWMLLVAPWIHLAAGSPYFRGLFYDMGLLVVHGLLSLALFGLPRAPGKAWMLWVGLPPAGMTARNEFLSTGWGIAAAFLYLPLLPAAPFVILVVGIPLFLLWLMLPLRVILHVYLATGYAARRWRAKGRFRQKAAEEAAMIVFVTGHIANLVF